MKSIKIVSILIVISICSAFLISMSGCGDNSGSPSKKKTDELTTLQVSSSLGVTLIENIGIYTASHTSSTNKYTLNCYVSENDKVKTIELTYYSVSVYTLSSVSSLNRIAKKDVGQITLGELKTLNCYLMTIKMVDMIAGATSQAEPSLQEVCDMFGGTTMNVGNWKIYSESEGDDVIITASYDKK